MTAPSPDPRLRELAGRLVWWQPPERTLADERRFLLQVLAYADWEEAELVRETFGEAALIDALGHAAPGVLDDRSWSYWHVRLGMLPVPPLPRRAL